MFPRNIAALTLLGAACVWNDILDRDIDRQVGKETETCRTIAPRRHALTAAATRANEAQAHCRWSGVSARCPRVLGDPSRDTPRSPPALQRPCVRSVCRMSNFS